MKYGDLTFGQVEAIMNKLGGMAGVKDLLSGKTAVSAAGKAIKKAKSSAEGMFRVFVSYTQPLSDLIKSAEFNWVNSDITEKHFPINQRPNGAVEMKVFTVQDLVGATRSVTSKEVIQEMDNRGYRPAELPELLAFAMTNPDEQRKYPIVSLGSIWQDWLGDQGVPYLWGGGFGRSLYLGWFDDGWDSRYRFLAVRKS